MLASYVYLGEHALSRIEGGAESYYLRDALGSVVATVDGTGNVVDRFEYDAFGNAVGSGVLPSASAGDFRFQGMWLDSGALAELGVYFVRARAYDAPTGRFTTRDPADGRLRRPETHWPYMFANGNPEWFRDPSGAVTLLGISVRLQMEFQFRIAQTVRVLATGSQVVGQWVMHGHHVIPIFLGGRALGVLYRLPAAAHRTYHSILLRLLHARGFPTTLRTTQQWTDYIQRNPGAQSKVWATILDAARILEQQLGAEFAAKNDGLSFVETIWRAMYR